MTEALIFPIPILTPIIGRPTNSTLQVLQQQLYQNARAIPCDLGGGADGHLGLIMTPGTYLTRPNAIRFVVPVSPGLLAAPPNDVNMLVVAEHKRVYNNNIKVFQKYQSVRNALIQQIIAAVEHTYIQALCDIDFGFHDVHPYELLAHLKTTYGVLTGLEIEQNRARLSEAWDTTSPIETLWARIVEIRRIATDVNQAISDAAVIALVLPMFERTGLFLHSINAWNGMTLTDQTFVRFKSHFTRANELRITALSSTDLRFADANAAIGSTTGTKISAPSGTDTGSVSVSGNRMYYCWSHGLGTSPAHTGRNCRSPHEGHIAAATAFKRQGGSNIFSTREDHPERTQRRNNN